MTPSSQSPALPDLLKLCDFALKHDRPGDIRYDIAKALKAMLDLKSAHLPDLGELERLATLLEGPDTTPVYEHASHVDGTYPPRHYSNVFHVNHRGMEVARFTDNENHRADAELYIWFRTHGLSLLHHLRAAQAQTLQADTPTTEAQSNTSKLPSVRGTSGEQPPLPPVGTAQAPVTEEEREELAREIFTAQSKALDQQPSWDEIKAAAASQPWQKKSLAFIYDTADALLSLGYRKSKPVAQESA